MINSHQMENKQQILSALLFGSSLVRKYVT